MKRVFIGMVVGVILVVLTLSGFGDLLLAVVNRGEEAAKRTAERIANCGGDCDIDFWGECPATTTIQGTGSTLRRRGSVQKYARPNTFETGVEIDKAVYMGGAGYNLRYNLSLPLCVLREVAPGEYVGTHIAPTDPDEPIRAKRIWFALPSGMRGQMEVTLVWAQEPP